MKILAKLAVAAVAAFAILQFVHPRIPTKPATAELQAPPVVQHIIEKDCYSCHSDQPRLSWFDQIEPGYWFVRRDIRTARRHLNFSTLGAKPAAVQKATLYEAVNMIQLGAMPLPQFLALHPEAKVTPQELAELKAYLAPWSPAPMPPAGESKAAAAPPAIPAMQSAPTSLSQVQPEWNGLPFDPSFESWKPLATTDRGDNNTFRVILGNDIAVAAAKSGNISPWPDGARFAKIAWQQQPGADGLVHPGHFVQVELMVKDARRYHNTDGWGWGRWRGLNLAPYGQNAHFVNECTSCHLPVRGNDYVYTLPITPARVQRDEVVNNAAAALPANLPWQPLGWSVITMYVDPATRTTAMLYGNDAAISGIHPRGAAAGSPTSSYPAGAVLALVTWTQRDDPHWFGARIPDVPQSVEFVEVAAPGSKSAYHRFSASTGSEDHVAPAAADQRMKLILGLSPASLP